MSPLSFLILFVWVFYLFFVILLSALSILRLSQAFSMEKAITYSILFVPSCGGILKLTQLLSIVQSTGLSSEPPFRCPLSSAEHSDLWFVRFLPGSDSRTDFVPMRTAIVERPTPGAPGSAHGEPAGTGFVCGWKSRRTGGSRSSLLMEPVMWSVGSFSFSFPVGAPYAILPAAPHPLVRQHTPAFWMGWERCGSPAVSTQLGGPGDHSHALMFPRGRNRSLRRSLLAPSWAGNVWWG